MSLTRTEIKRHLSTVLRLQRKVEETMSEQAREGYIKNQWGSYDHKGATDKLVAALRDLTDKAPEEAYFPYLLAGVLARARQFDEAVSLYSGLASGPSQYAEPAGLILPTVFWCAGEKVLAQEALDAYNKPFLAKGIEPQHLRVEDMFYPHPPC